MCSPALESHEGQRCSKSAHDKCKSTTTLRGSEERREDGKNPRWGCDRIVTVRSRRPGWAGWKPGDICHRSCISPPTQELSNASLPRLTRPWHEAEYGCPKEPGGVYRVWGVEAWTRCVPLALNTQARGCLACTRAHPSLPTSAWHQVLLHSPQSVSQHRPCQPHCPVTHTQAHTHTGTCTSMSGDTGHGPAPAFPAFTRTADSMLRVLAALLGSKPKAIISLLGKTHGGGTG